MRELLKLGNYNMSGKSFKLQVLSFKKGICPFRKESLA